MTRGHTPSLLEGVASETTTEKSHTQTLTCIQLRVVRRGYCAAVKECADLGFMVN